MIRVLVVESAGNLWGSERALLDLLDYLSDIQKAVCCPPATAINSELTRRNVPVLPYFVYGLHQKTKLSRLRAALGVGRACLEFRPDLIYLNQSGVYRVVAAAALPLGIP